MYKIYIIIKKDNSDTETILREPDFGIGFYFDSIKETQEFINLHGSKDVKYTVLPILTVK